MWTYVYMFMYVNTYVWIQLALLQKEFNFTYQNMYVKVKWYNKFKEKETLKII